MLGSHLYRTFALLLFCGLPQLSVTNCIAHPFHTSLTEMEWNPDTSRWEVGVRVYAIDLEAAVQKLFPEFKLDDHLMEDSAAEQYIRNYIERNFFSNDVRLVDGKKRDSLEKVTDLSERRPSNDPFEEKISKLHWVGSELEGSWVWLYFEHEVPLSGQMRIIHRLLFDVNPDQINVVSIRQGRKRFSTQTHAQLDHFVFQTAPDNAPQVK